MSLNPRPVPAVAGVIGYPIAQSKSPLIHRFWLKKRGIDGDYVRLPVAPDDFEVALRHLPYLGLRGVNITMPYKRRAHDACNSLDPLAALTGAVNTVIVEGDGRLAGFNTDVDGFLEPLADVDLVGKNVALVGAGGAAAAVIAALAGKKIGRLHLINRSHSAAEQLCMQLARVLADVQVEIFEWSARHAALAGMQLLVNTTLLGMTGQPVLDLDLSHLPSESLVYDIITSPSQTALLMAAAARGHKVIGGHAMLIGQAARAFTLFYGVSPPRDTAHEAALQSLLHL